MDIEVNTRLLLDKCPIFSTVFSILIEQDRLSILYDQYNHFAIDRRSAMDPELNLDTTVLEIILENLFKTSFNKFISKSFSIIEVEDKKMFELYYLDSDIRVELNTLRTLFGVESYSQYVYSDGHLGIAAMKFKFEKEKFLNFINNRIDLNLLHLRVKKHLMEVKLS